MSIQYLAPGFKFRTSRYKSPPLTTRPCRLQPFLIIKLIPHSSSQRLQSPTVAQDHFRKDLCRDQLRLRQGLQARGAEAKPTFLFPRPVGRTSAEVCRGCEEGSEADLSSEFGGKVRATLLHGFERETPLRMPPR